MDRSLTLMIMIEETEVVVSLKIDQDEQVENLKALIEVESGILLNDQLLTYNGRELQPNSARVNEFQIQDNDMLQLSRKQLLAPTRNQQQQQPVLPQQQVPDAQQFANSIRANPDILQQILSSNPALADAVLRNDLPVLRDFLQRQDAARRTQEAEQFRRANMFNADPFNLEAQKAIEEEIRMENVNENFANATEFTPEAFGRVVMLYIDCEVHNTPIKAFIDTGAQMSIMSQSCAERCGIMRLLDRRWNGIAKGVGTARIIGRIHVVQIKIGKAFFPCSITVLESQGQDLQFILGLDMIRRHQIILDLKNSELVIGTEKAPFLAEKDIPFLKEEEEQELKDHLAPPTTSPQILVHPPIASATTTTAQPRTNTTTVTTNTNNRPPALVPVPVPAPVPAPAPENPLSPMEQAVRQLMNIGARRDEAIRLLTRYDGNVDLAASRFFG